MTGSHTLRFGRAEVHLKELEAKVAAWGDTEPYAIWLEPDPEPPYQLVKVTPDPIDAGPFALLTSDCLHNLRSALDNLAYALACAFTNPLPAEYAEFSEFPIFGDVDPKGNPNTGGIRFNRTERGGGRHKMRGIDPAAQAIIEGLQPYQRGNAYDEHPLWVLHELNRIDKHRFLHFASFWPSGVAFDLPKFVNAAFGAPGQQTTIDGYEVGVVEEGETATLGRLALTPVDPTREMQVKLLTIPGIAFPRAAPIAQERDVIATLREIYLFGINEVVLPLTGFL